MMKKKTLAMNNKGKESDKKASVFCSPKASVKKPNLFVSFKDGSAPSIMTKAKSTKPVTESTLMSEENPERPSVANLISLWESQKET